MSLRGKLEDFNTTQLLNLVHLARKTGSLQVNRGINGDHRAHASELFFRDGKLIHASMDGYDGALTSMLVKGGKLPARQAGVINERASSLGDKRLALILIKNGMVSKEDVISSATRYIHEIVYSLFGWRRGQFTFEPDKQPQSSRITIPIDLANLIIEGSRRVQETERLEEELPDLDVALRFTDHPDAKLKQIRLNEQEWKVISFVRPTNSLRRIAQATQMSDTEIRRIAYGLLQAGIVDLVGRASVPQPQISDNGRPRPTRTRRTYVKRGIVNRLIERIKNL
jgi:hypothetical protein